MSAAAADTDNAPAVAIVTEVDGAASVLVRGRAARPEVADSVEQGASIVLQSGARIVLVYPGLGTVYEARGPGRFVAGREAVESTGSSGRVSRRDVVSALRALKIRAQGTTLQGSAAMRGGAQRLRAEGPTGSRFARDPLRLCWTPPGAQWLYRVRLIDDDGTVLFEAHTGDSALEVPSGIALQPGVPYLWHVLATGPSGQSAEAVGEFRRLDAATEQALERAEAAMPELDATGRALVRIAMRQQGVASRDGGQCLPGERAETLSASAAPE